MSGGHWDYYSHKIEQMLTEIGMDETAATKWPTLCQLLVALGPIFYRIEHDMDWEISGDATTPDGWEKARLAELIDAVLKAAPDEWFPRGKWATIQAIQGRSSNP